MTKYHLPAFRPSVFCPEYQVVYDAFGTKPDTIYTTYQNTLVKSLVDAGYWVRMDLFYVFANNNEANSLINWINPGTFNCTNVHSTAFVAWQGFHSDGTNDYLNTNYNPETEATHFSQNSATGFIYLRDVPTETKYQFGSSDGTDMFTMVADETGYNSRVRTNSSNANWTGWAGAQPAGPWAITRTGASKSCTYRNDDHEDGTEASTDVPGYDIYIGCYNNAGTAAGFATNEFSIFIVMDGITDADFAGIKTIIKTYMDALGKGV